jgi:hypothetical protein
MSSELHYVITGCLESWPIISISAVTQKPVSRYPVLRVLCTKQSYVTRVSGSSLEPGGPHVWCSCIATVHDQHKLAFVLIWYHCAIILTIMWSNYLLTLGGLGCRRVLFRKHTRRWFYMNIPSSTTLTTEEGNWQTGVQHDGDPAVLLLSVSSKGLSMGSGASPVGVNPYSHSWHGRPCGK